MKNVNLFELLVLSRKKHKLTIADLSMLTQIDASLISRCETGKRMPTEEMLASFAFNLDIDLSLLRKLWLAEKIKGFIAQYPEAEATLHMLAEEFTAYNKANKRHDIISDSLKKELVQIDKLKADIKKFKPLNKTQLEKLNEHFNLVYTYDSNKIEGNTLTLQETALVVNKGITIGGKSLREHMEAINHKEAIGLMYEIINDKNIVSERNIKDLHALVLRSIDNENAGTYRKCEVMITGSSHTVTPFYDIPNEMQKLVEYYNKYSKVLHPVVLAADMHYKLAGIHPFIDGNGRTSRLLMNLILLKHGYLIASIKGEMKTRLEYYKALEEAQVNENDKVFRSLVANYVKHSLHDYLKLIK